MSLVRDWDVQIEAANGDDVAASIGILRCSQSVHQAWLDWIENDIVYEPTVYNIGNKEEEAAFHRRCVDEYEKIIGVIERLAGY